MGGCKCQLSVKFWVICQCLRVRVRVRLTPIFYLENIYIFQVVVVGDDHWSLPVRHSVPRGRRGTLV